MESMCHLPFHTHLPASIQSYLYLPHSHCRSHEVREVVDGRSTYSHTTLLRVTLLHKLTVHTKYILVNITFKMQLIQLALAFVLLLSIASGILTSPNLSSLLISPPRLLSFCSSLLLFFALNFIPFSSFIYFVLHFISSLLIFAAGDTVTSFALNQQEGQIYAITGKSNTFKSFIVHYSIICTFYIHICYLIHLLFTTLFIDLLLATNWLIELDNVAVQQNNAHHLDASPDAISGTPPLLSSLFPSFSSLPSLLSSSPLLVTKHDLQTVHTSRSSMANDPSSCLRPTASPLKRIL